MSLLIISWLLVIGLLVLIGYSVQFFLEKEARRTNLLELDEYFFLGLLCISVVTGYTSLILPINTYGLLGLLVLTSLLYFWIKGRTSYPLVINLWRQIFRHRIVGYVLLVLIILFAVLGSMEVTLFDTGFYHTQSIKWIRSYPVVPGLGNLHGRFAFNSMFFLPSALFTIDYADWLLIYPLNGAIAIVLSYKLLNSIVQYIEAQDQFKFTLYLISLCLMLAFLSRHMNTPSTDIAPAAISIYVLLMYLEKVRPLSKKDFVLMVGLALTCVMYKLSMVLFPIILIPLIWAPFSKKRFGEAITIGIFVCLPFFLRNYYLSGYLVYPFPTIDLFVVDWKIPADEVILEKAFIKSCGRITCKDFTDYWQAVLAMPFGEWFPMWFTAKNMGTRILLLVNSLIPFVAILYWIKGRPKMAFVSSVVCLNLLFWFVNAPDPRFAYGPLVMGGALVSTSLGLVGVKRFLGTKPSMITATIVSISLILLLVLIQSKLKIDHFKHASNWLNPIGLPKPKIKEITTPVKYYIPKGDGYRCFNAPLPCAHHAREGIQMRGQTLKEGFRIGE